MHRKTLPKTIYVKWVDEDAPFLDANVIIDKLADKDCAELVGVYQLIEVRKVELKVETTLKQKKVKS